MDSDLRERIKEQLVDALGKQRVLWNKADLTPYTKDTYRIRFDEDFKNFPDFVVLPETTAEVQKIVQIAAKHKIPLIPKGGGSNRTGMLVPVYGGIIVDTIKMNKVLEVSVPDLYVTVQPGITLKELEEHLAKFGVALNQIQGSLKVATVGGSISTSGFSRKHQKYGTIADRVMSLEVVLADGRILRTSVKVLYTSTGYRLHQIFIAAEGTLGIITEATLRVEPLPEERAVILAFFNDFWGANEAALKTMASGVTFTGGEAYELLDPTEWGGQKDTKGAFYVEFEGTKGEVEAEVAFVDKIIKDTGGLKAKPQYAQDFVDKYTLQWCGARVLTGFEDALTTYIPTARAREFYEKLWNEIMPRHGMGPLPGEKYSLDVGRYRMYAGRFQINKSEKGWQEYQKCLREVAELAISLGGSISSCHGVGIEHRESIRLEYDEVALDAMRSIKKALDPDNIMNPGKKIPEKK